jgi:hypothetical protein
MKFAAAVGLTLLASAAAAQNYTVEGSCRDGAPHGGYELRDAKGQVRVVGAFNRGKRAGSFLFWSSAGARIAQLPYEDDLLSGTLAVWFSGADRTGDPRPRLEAAYVQGRLSGDKRSWFPEGRVRAELRYDNGVLVAARAFGETGKLLPESDARTLAMRDFDADAAYIASLETMVRNNPPRCEPASDRLEKA